MKKYLVENKVVKNGFVFLGIFKIMEIYSIYSQAVGKYDRDYNEHKEYCHAASDLRETLSWYGLSFSKSATEVSIYKDWYDMLRAIDTYTNLVVKKSLEAYSQEIQSRDYHPRPEICDQHLQSVDN